MQKHLYLFGINRINGGKDEWRCFLLEIQEKTILDSLGLLTIEASRAFFEAIGEKTGPSGEYLKAEQGTQKHVGADQAEHIKAVLGVCGEKRIPGAIIWEIPRKEPPSLIWQEISPRLPVS